MLSLHESLYAICMSGARRGQKRTWDPLELELQIVVSLTYGCWELNPGPLEEQPVLLTDDPLLQGLGK